MIRKALKFLKDTFIGRDTVSRKEFKKLEVAERKWSFLWVLDWYIAREFLVKWSILLLVFVFGFIMGDVYESLGDFLDAEAPVSAAVWYFVLRLPGNVRFILPISVLLGTIWTMAAFGKNLEVTAMRASGVSLARCGMPIMFIGLLVTFLNIYFNEFLVPYTEHKAILTKAIATKNAAPQQKMLIYRSIDGDRAWFFRVFDENSFQQNVIFKKYREDETLEYDLNIERARFIEGKGWHFYGVTRTEYTADGLMPYRPKKIEELFMSLDEVDEEPDDILNAIKEEDALPIWTIWEIASSSEEISERMKNVYMTLFCYRLAFPWACFLAVFLGIPIATKSERAGVMSSIMVAVGMIVGYIICVEMFSLLGKQGTLNPIVAGLGPTLAFIMYGYYKVLMGGGN